MSLGQDKLLNFNSSTNSTYIKQDEEKIMLSSANEKISISCCLLKYARTDKKVNQSLAKYEAKIEFFQSRL